MRAALFVAAVILTVVRADVAGDLITDLPGWNGPTPTVQYSGYINITEDKHIHYWFVESANSPTEDPLTLWFNGGPGCSSLDGFFYEMGPFRFDPSGTTTNGVPTLVPNPYAWNTISNMLYVEAPVGVGYSYSDNPADYNTNDTQTAEDNFAFLVQWLQAYPEYQGRDTFIAGESYAGVYVPTLVQQVLEHNEANESDISLVGFMVGNGCTGTETGACSLLGNQIRGDFLWGHGLFSTVTYDAINEQNCWTTNAGNCSELNRQLAQEVGNINIYDVYDRCINGGLSGSKRKHAYFKVARNLYDPMGLPYGPSECIDGISAYDYLNNPAVRAALHVQPSGNEWVICTSAINYTSTVTSLMPIYPTLMAAYRTLIYNGDVDACVPYNGNVEWTMGLGFETTESWRPWVLQKQVAGYVTTYAVPDSDGKTFSFATVNGAGHPVPQYKPQAALIMFERFLKNEPL